VKRATTLSGRPTGTIYPGSEGRIWVSGTLNAYSTIGTLVPLKFGQPIEIQARRPGIGNPYRTVVRENGSTQRQRLLPGAGERVRAARYSLRVRYRSPYQTIASFTYLGAVR